MCLYSWRVLLELAVFIDDKSSVGRRVCCVRFKFLFAGLDLTHF